MPHQINRTVLGAFREQELSDDEIGAVLDEESDAITERIRQERIRNFDNGAYDEERTEDPLAGDVDSWVPADPAETHEDAVARQHGDYTG